MTTSNDCLTVLLTRKFGSMPALAQKSAISLDFHDEGFKPRRVSGSSDPEKTGTILCESQGVHGLPLLKVSFETPANSAYGADIWRENGRHTTLGVSRMDASESKTPNKGTRAFGSAGKWKPDEALTFLPSRYSEWFNRSSSLNYRIGVKTTDTSAKPQAQQSRGQNRTANTGQTTKGMKARKSLLRRKTDTSKKTATTDNDGEKYSQETPLNRVGNSQDYRQKCIQWLQSLPDTNTLAMNLRWDNRWNIQENENFLPSC